MTMIKSCKDCGNDYTGKSNSQYCPTCKKKRIAEREYLLRRGIKKEKPVVQAEQKPSPLEIIRKRKATAAIMARFNTL
jgi:hypothetical protein